MIYCNESSDDNRNVFIHYSVILITLSNDITVTFRKYKKDIFIIISNKKNLSIQSTVLSKQVRYMIFAICLIFQTFCVGITCVLKKQ